MSLNHSPSIVRDNLLLNLDFKNAKKFSTDLGTNNLVQDWKYNIATWSNLFPANTQITTGIDAPDGSKTAVRITCKTTGSSLLRVNFNSFTPNGTDTYIISFWVRKISGSISTSNQLLSDLADGISYGYISQLVINKWVRVTYSEIPTATAKTWVDLLSNNSNDYVLDFWGVKVELKNDTVTTFPIKDLVGGYTFNNYRPLYTTIDQDFITFDRLNDPKQGGVLTSTMTGALTVVNFLYNDHTSEIWFKINDITPVGSVNEAWSTLLLYSGFHAGFMYTASQMTYRMWNGNSTDNVLLSWTVGTTGAQINQGQWYQLVAVRNSDSFVPYINGTKIGTITNQPTSAVGVLTSNNLYLGAAVIAAANTSSYVYYSKNSIANVKMYNRALSDQEIKINFNALRGRFGL